MARPLETLRERLSDITWRTLIPTKKAFILFTGGVFSLLILLAGTAQFTSRPSFCTSCHYMQPFYDSWETSSHSDVSCVTCHFPPGLEGKVRGKLTGLEQVVSYVGRSYTRRKPWAEIEDESCLQSGCHDSQNLEGIVAFKGVVFDHAHHLEGLRRGKELRCTSCHSQVVQGEHLLVTESTCFLCHMKQAGDVDAELTEQLTDCQTCHNWEAMPAEERTEFRFDHTDVLAAGMECTQCHSNTMIGDGFVPLENCNSCHFEPERLNKIGETELMHRTHIAEHKIECNQCHLAIQHKIERVTAESELQCTTCHDATHEEQLSLFTGFDHNGHESIPNPMLEVGLNCESCHIFHEQLLGEAGVQTANPQSCETCHGRGYARLLRLWEESAANKLLDLDRSTSRVEQTIRSVRSPNRASALLEVEDAKFSLRLVQVGKAVHNMTLSDQLIGRSYEHLNMALEAVGADYSLTGWESDTIVPSECANCHTGIEAVETSHDGRPYNHNLHVVGQEIACNTCHSNARVHGQLIVDPLACNSCHHNPERIDVIENCATCHETQAQIYSGTYLERDYADYMFEEEITCDECHMDGNRVIRPEPVICVDCHDEDYADTMIEWRVDITVAADEIQTLLDQAPQAFRSTEDYDRAVTVIRDLGADYAGGIHNYEMIIELLDEIKDTIPTPDE